MTNKEKAREIAKTYDKSEYSVSFMSAIVMAKWKDGQFREILRKRWKESQANPNDEQLKIALFDEIMDIFLGED